MSNVLKIYTLFFFVFNCTFLIAQKKTIEIIKTNELFEIDGALNEASWKNANWAQGFVLNYPHDSSLATQQTKVAAYFNDNALFIAAICSFDKESKRAIRTLKRDFNRDLNDAFSVIFDPLIDNTNGFAFTVNVKGAQSEAIIHSGSRADLIWDNKWETATSSTQKYWIAEIKIPFRTLRYDFNSVEWGVNFVRTDLASNERSCWNKVPREFDPFSLNFAGKLKWGQSISKSKKNMALIPYITAGLQQEDNEENTTLLNAGGDVKLGLTSSLNLDLTINPDFSQAEADAQQINLDRFSLYFPERRNFFTENNDLFANFGFSRIRPFFSRRIGLSEDGDLIPILFGARLSGKVNRDLRIGLLNVQTGANAANTLPQNFTAACFQRQIGGGNLAGIVVNKETFNETGDQDFNRVVGLDYNILSKDNRLRGKVFYHQSFSDDNKNFQYAQACWLSYNGRTVNAAWNHEYVNKNYQADVGFVPREGKGYWRLEPWIQKNFYPKSGILNRHGPRLYYDLYTDNDFKKTEQTLQLSYVFAFNNTSRLNVRLTNTYLRLIEPFNPNANDTLLFSEGEYKWDAFSFNFTPVRRKKLSFGFYGDYGTFFLGKKYTYGGSMSYRFEPYLQLSLNANFNYLNMPQPYLSDNLILLSPRMDISFTRKLFLSTFLQINQQSKLMALNSRLQYRFKPMSDLFLVFNQTINTETNHSERSAIVLKLN